ncbi:MAG TPA: hypothetical protein VIJ87_18780 [Pyrinomonadaceae bacterium]|jgi:hypothetical protein
MKATMKPASSDELSKLPFKESYPTPETSEQLYQALQFQRAVQVYLWALPAMNMVAMRDGQAATFFRPPGHADSVAR